MQVTIRIANGEFIITLFVTYQFYDLLPHIFVNFIIKMWQFNPLECRSLYKVQYYTFFFFFLFLKAPVPLEKWDGILDATKDGELCTQIDMADGGLKGSENCLFINVYTPNVRSTIYFPVSDQ